jgi:hypothetical protein
MTTLEGREVSWRFRCAILRAGRGAAIAAAVALSAVTTAASEEPALVPSAAASTAILDYYPAKAREGGVEGKVILGCNLTEHIALRHCHVIYETPGGYGFGQAALRLAALSNGNPAVGTRAQFGDVDFTFALHPPSISPDTLEPYHLTTLPLWLSLPSGDQMARTYPHLAMLHGISGGVLLDCQAGLDTRLTDCVVTREDPAGQGFGDAALALSSIFRIRPGSRDGVMTGDVHIQVPIRWVAPH